MSRFTRSFNDRIHLIGTRTINARHCVALVNTMNRTASFPLINDDRVQRKASIFGPQILNIYTGGCSSCVSLLSGNLMKGKSLPLHIEYNWDLAHS